MKSTSLKNTSFWIGVSLFLLSLTLNTSNMPEQLFFGFEQGRDAIVATKIARLEDFVLVGPKTDIAGIFHGAWYYYLLALLYGVAQGDPAIVSLLVITLSSTVSVLMFIFAKSILNQRWAALIGLLTAVSFEFISYSRWLSNVTPALPLIVISFFGLWKYKRSNKNLWFIIGVTAAFAAAQFQFILTLWFAILLGLLLVTKFLPVPRSKTLGITAGLVGLLYAPMIVFNLRNDFITIRSVHAYFFGAEGQHVFNLASSLQGYVDKLLRLYRKTVFDGNGLVGLGIGLGLILGLIRLFMQPTTKITSKHKEAVRLSLAWLTMTFPVIVFTESNLTQVYMGTGLALLLLVGIGWAHLWPTNWGKSVVVLSLLLLTLNLKQTIYKLYTNSDVLYITIQDNYNLKDQKAVLAAIHQDTGDNPFQLRTFTIPYFQSEAWEYLLPYYYPNSPRSGDSVVNYVIIEQPVEPYWEETWISELGETSLVWEKKFGHFRLQKRIAE